MNFNSLKSENEEIKQKNNSNLETAESLRRQVSILEDQKSKFSDKINEMVHTIV